MLQAAPLFEPRADVLRALAESAANSDYKHHADRKLFVEMTGDYTPRVKVSTSRSPLRPEDLSQLTDAELDMIGREVLRSQDADADAEPAEPEEDDDDAG
jgi:hypothetical protein